MTHKDSSLTRRRFLQASSAVTAAATCQIVQRNVLGRGQTPPSETFGGALIGVGGRGPAPPHIKEKIPDAHSDFIFAVAAEEFGMFACLIIIALFAFIVLRGFTRVLKNKDSFSQLAVVGLLSHFGLQAIINLASVSYTHLTLPTKA